MAPLDLQILNTVFSHTLRSRLRLTDISCFLLALEDTESLFLLLEQVTYFNQFTEEHSCATEEAVREETRWPVTENREGRNRGGGLTGRNEPMKGKNAKVPRNSE